MGATPTTFCWPVCHQINELIYTKRLDRCGMHRKSMTEGKLLIAGSLATVRAGPIILVAGGVKVHTTTPTQPHSHWLAGVTLHTSLFSHWWKGGTLDTWLDSHWSFHVHITPHTHLPHLPKAVGDMAISF